MPFKVSYDAPASVIGGAAYISGLGRFAQDQAQLQLQQQELAQRDLQQRRAIDAQQQSQMFGAQQDAIDRQFRLGMLGQQQQFEAQQFDQRMGAQAELASEEDRRAFIMERYRNKEWKLNDASKRRLHEINNRMSEVRMDPKLTPDERSKALAGLDAEHWGILGSPAPTLPGEEEPPPIGERIEANTHKRDIVHPRTGEVIGYELWSPKIVRSSGEVEDTLIDTVMFGDETQKAEIEQMKAQEKIRMDSESARMKAEADRVKLWNDQQKLALDHYSKITTEMVPATDAKGNVIMDGGGEGSLTTPKPRQRLRTPAEVKAMMENFIAGMATTALPPPPAIMPQGPQQPQITAPPDKVVGQLQRAGLENPDPSMFGSQQGQYEMTGDPAQEAGPDRFAPAPNHGYLPEQQQPQADPELMALAQQAGMPVMASPEEAMKLPPGTKFLTPDGQILERP